MWLLRVRDGRKLLRLRRRQIEQMSRFCIVGLPTLAFVTQAVSSDTAQFLVSIEGDGKKEELGPRNRIH